MPKGYWIGQVRILEPVAYADYARDAKIAVKKFGGRYLIRGGVHQAPEGDTLDRHVMIEFEDYKTALACYASPGYQAAKAKRINAAIAHLLIIEGSDEELQQG